jgi:type I restriction enzyme S subunit
MNSKSKITAMKEASKPAPLPKLRFPEFRDAAEWKSKRLGELFSDRQESGMSGLPLLSLMDKEGIVPQADSNRKNNSNSDKSKYLRVVPGDIAYNTMRMWEGRSAIVGLEGLVSPAYTVCEPQPGTHSLLFSYYFKTPQLIEQFQRFSQGLVKDTLNLKYPAFAQISAPVPTYLEQQKIAECLSSVDELIAAQARKLDALKTHKKGLMQQLFPREGETQPRLRFPEFQNAGEWEMKRLSGLIDLISGMHLSPADYSTSGEVPYFTGPSDFTNDLQTVTKWTKRTANVSQADDTLITVKGSGVGEIWYSTLPEVALGRQLMAIRSKNGSSRFMFQFLLTKRSRFEDLGSGNLIPGLSRAVILELEASVPFPAEQQRIADCLSSLDDLIAAQTQTLEALKTHKQGLMQQLFPSPSLLEP